MKKIILAVCLSALLPLANAEDAPPAATPPAPVSTVQSYALTVKEVFTATKNGIESLFDKGFSFLGIKYLYGGNSPQEGGFDCSGLVRKVFADALGLNLPRTAAEMARLGDTINKDELKPGDLVFFNTMRRTFSHVGIYLGENKFLHAPSTGKAVRVENFDSDYWAKRFDGARRLVSDAQAAGQAPTQAKPKK